MVTLKNLTGAFIMVLFACATAGAQNSPAGDAERTRAQADVIRSRQAIATMEAVLQRAVSYGAEMVMAQVNTVVPTARPRLSNTPRVSGVRLPGYGVHFTVQVPDMNLSILWDLMRPSQSRDASVAMMVQQMKTQLMGMAPGPARSQLLEQIYQVELSLATGNARADARGIQAASIKPEGVERQTDKVDPAVVDDPEAAYTREVKAALIEAMLVNSQPLSIAADEWLTIAARNGVPSNPLVPGDSVDGGTWLMRVKGSVLAALRAGTITKDEAQKQVEVTEQ